jgi:hypothetical protein
VAGGSSGRGLPGQGDPPVRGRCRSGPGAAAGGVERPGDIALARVLSRSGWWIVLHGAALVADGRRRAAVIVEPAHPARIAPLLMSAYGMTEREQEVTRLVLQGHSTAAIAGRLSLSPHTVQQHLKGSSRRPACAAGVSCRGKVFFAYYERRVRDNEQRAMVGRLLRGGPYDRPARTAADS